jgi:hypothetical protein
MAIQQVKISKDCTLKLDASIGWLIKYREQFGHDILPDLLPLISAGIELAVNTGNSIGTNAIDFKKVLEAIDKEAIQDLMMNVAMLESTTVLNIIWALNANYLKKNGQEVKPLDEWAEQFDNFPLDVILPKALKLIVESTVSSKNLKRLQSLTTTMKKSAQTESLSGQSQEG